MAFPTLAQVESFHTVGDIANFIPLKGDQADKTTARGAIYSLLGCTDDTPPRIVGMESDTDFDSEVAQCMLDPDGTPQKPNLTSRGSMKLLGKICRVMAGTEPHPKMTNTPQASTSVVPAAGPSPGIATPATTLGISNIVRLSLITSQADESTALRIDETEMIRCLARWK